MKNYTIPYYPVEPETPENPGTPGDGEVPGTPEAPSGVNEPGKTGKDDSSGKKPSSQSGSKSLPQTGESSNDTMNLVGLLLILSGIWFMVSRRNEGANE